MNIRMSDYVRECEHYYSTAPLYENGLILVQSGIEKKDIDSFVMWLRRYCNSYKGLSFLLVISTHESKGYIEKITIRNGKVGRPKTVVVGETAEKHIHLLIVNTNADNSIKDIKKELKTYCTKRRCKRANLKRQKIQDLNGMFIVKYMYRQADSTYRGGAFDFDYFTDERYCNYENILSD